MNESTIAIFVYLGATLLVSLLGLLTFANFARYRFKGDKTNFFFTILATLFFLTCLSTLFLVPAAEPVATPRNQTFN